MSAPAFCLAIEPKASSKSSEDLTMVGRTVSPKLLAAPSITLSEEGWTGLSDTRTAIRVAVGAKACSNSTPLTCSSFSKLDTPVTLAPGRARLVTSPEPTGSAGPIMTIGMVAVARLAARVPGVVSATMTSGFSATSSAARLENRSFLPSAHPIKDDVPPLDIPGIAQRSCECEGNSRWRTLKQDSDAIDFRLLRVGSGRRGKNARTTHHGDERSPVHHWITWSARSSTDCGIFSPNVLAVLRLMTNWYSVGCWIGNSDGLAPLRILST